MQSSCADERCRALVFQLVQGSKRERFGWWVAVFKEFVCSHWRVLGCLGLGYLVSLDLVSSMKANVRMSAVGGEAEVICANAEVR